MPFSGSVSSPRCFPSGVWCFTTTKRSVQGFLLVEGTNEDLPGQKMWKTAAEKITTLKRTYFYQENNAAASGAAS